MHSPSSLQASVVVQPLPSLQVVPGLTAVCVHRPPTHLSVVQDLLSSHVLTTPPTQAPAALHFSPVVQASLSLQSRPDWMVCLQPACGSQVSTVHGSLSSQSSAVPLVHEVPEH